MARKSAKTTTRPADTADTKTSKRPAASKPKTTRARAPKAAAAENGSKAEVAGRW